MEKKKSISEIKRELYNKLKSHPDIVGAGIQGTGESEYIAIYVISLSSDVIPSIPETFQGIQVKIEETGAFSFQK